MRYWFRFARRIDAKIRLDVDNLFDSLLIKLQ
jgi:hypothetical protein